MLLLLLMMVLNDADEVSVGADWSLPLSSQQ